MRVKFEYSQGAEKLVIELEGTKKTLKELHLNQLGYLFRKGWTLKKTTVLDKEKSKAFIR